MQIGLKQQHTKTPPPKETTKSNRKLFTFKGRIINPLWPGDLHHKTILSATGYILHSTPRYITISTLIVRGSFSPQNSSALWIKYFLLGRRSSLRAISPLISFIQLPSFRLHGPRPYSPCPIPIIMYNQVKSSCPQNWPVYLMLQSDDETIIIVIAVQFPKFNFNWPQNISFQPNGTLPSNLY